MTLTIYPDATYISMRLALSRVRGPASQHTCPCGDMAQEWAYDRSDPNERVSEKGLAFSPDLAHYVATCKKCNRRAANERAKGWRAEQYPDKTAERFENYVMKLGPDECWIWIGTVKKHGYGQMWFKGKPDRAHRVSYEIHKGPIPEGLLIRHTCDNKVCVNPNHLLTGTRKDNARDAVERGLYPRGETQGRSKLTADQVTEIRFGRARGETQRALANRFGVSVAAVQFILNGTSWVGIGEYP